MNDQILTLEEASRYLKLHKGTVYKMARAGKIPASKIGKVWRFRRLRIDKWLERQENGPLLHRKSRTRKR
jgi:excisionase family DNA binding protein